MMMTLMNIISRIHVHCFLIEKLKKQLMSLDLLIFNPIMARDMIPLCNGVHKQRGYHRKSIAPTTSFKYSHAFQKILYSNATNFEALLLVTKRLKYLH